MTDAQVAFYFDPACPWTWNTGRWLVEVARARGLTIDWRPLSLTVLNAGKDIPEQYRAPMEVGHATLILQGTNDGTIPPASAEWLARQLQRSSLVLIDQAGHDLEMDQPERVLAATREFLGQPR